MHEVMTPAPDNLSSSELAVLESLNSATEAVSQRELARRAGISVGLVNAVLKKLVNTGYVKTARLNRRSIEYLLTPEGFAQTALRSYRYIVNTVRSYRDIQSRLHAMLERLRGQGIADFYLNGDGELADLVALFFEDEGLGAIKRGIPPPEARQKGQIAVLNAEPRPLRSRGVHVVELLNEFGNGHGKKTMPDSQPSAGHEKADREFKRIEEFYGVRKKQREEEEIL